MKPQTPTFSLALLPRRLQGMFNLNDPRWGRSDDKSTENSDTEADRPTPNVEPPRNDDRPAQDLHLV